MPSDFGLMAIASAVYTISLMFADIGLSNALIHFPRPHRTALSTLYWLNFGCALLLAALLAISAWPISLIYREPELLPIITLLSLGLPIAASGLQFRTIAEKELRFSTLAIIEAVATASGFLVAVPLGWIGFGTYSLVAAALTTVSVNNILTWIFLSKGIRPGFFFRPSEVREFLSYGAYKLGDTLFNTLRMQLDILIGGIFTGPAAMGAYSLPKEWTLRISNSVVNPIVTRVGLPVMAQVKHDRTALKLVYLKTLRMTASVNFPIYIALGVWAEDFVAVLLGEQWHSSSIYIRIFSIWGIIRSVGNPSGSLVYATGRVREALWWNLFLLMAVPIFLIAGVKIDGTYGLAIALLGTQILIFYPAFRILVQPSCGARFSEYANQMTAPLITGVVAVGVSYAASQSIEHLFLRLTSGLFLSTIIYLCMSALTNRPWLALMSDFLRENQKSKRIN